MIEQKEITCVDCIRILEKLDTTLTLLRGDVMKIVYALLGLVAANFGLKYLGTPWYLYLAVGSSIVASVFLLCATIFSWKSINKVWKMIGITIAIRLAGVSIIRIVCYSQDIPIYRWAGVPVQVMDAFICVLLIIMFWHNGRWNGRERRDTSNVLLP